LAYHLALNSFLCCTLRTDTLFHLALSPEEKNKFSSGWNVIDRNRWQRQSSNCVPENSNHDGWIRPIIAGIARLERVKRYVDRSIASKVASSLWRNSDRCTNPPTGNVKPVEFGQQQNKVTAPIPVSCRRAHTKKRKQISWPLHFKQLIPAGWPTVR
jgi:hypothetical protein